MTDLFSPIKIGPTTLSHRVVMAPLTRMRSETGAKPGKLMETYYAQRASEGGLIIGEATVAAPSGDGYLGSPGLYSDDQIAGWRAITDTVHAKGGRIFLQLYHAGRQSHVDMQPDGGSPVAPSALDYEGVAYTANGWVPSSPARALSEAEVAEMVQAFRRAAERGLTAGFDGVEIHGANGYLIDQFLQDGSNHRTDAYGGTIEKRARFLLDIVRETIAVWGSDRVAVRLGPSGHFGNMKDSDPTALFTYVAQQLDPLNLAYLHLIEPRVLGNSIDETRDQAPVAARLMRQHFHGIIVAAGGFDRESAQAIIAEGTADLVAFGRDFIANPDLPERLRLALPLNAYDRDTFYGGTAVGYTDYPAHAGQLATA